MGKILKYATTIALAAVMLFGTMTTAFADGNSGQVEGNDKKGSITIHKYKMPDAENAFESNTEDGGIKMDNLPETAEPLANVKFKITRVEQGDDGNWNDTKDIYERKTDINGEAHVEDLPLGRYKVEELGLESSDGSDAVLPNKKDNAMVGKAFYVDVPMTQADGQTLNYNVHVYPKNEVLSIEKDVTYVGNKHDSFDMQENQTWIIHTAIPGNIALTNDNGGYDTAKLYEVTDKIDSQLTYTKESVVVKAVGKDYKKVIDELEKDTDYSVKEPEEGNENTLTISLTDAGKIKLKKAINNPDDQAAFLQIRFDTVINETAKTGAAIYNDADLKFTTVKNVTVDVSVPENERPEVHTGKIAIKKVGEKVDGTLLEGVEFMIFDTAGKAQAAVERLQKNDAENIEKEALTVYDPNQNQFTTVVTTNDKGIAEFRGLAYYTNKASEKDQGDDAATGEKTYYLVEKKTVKGYQLPSKYFEVKVNHDSSIATEPSDTIINTKPSKLPAAGGNGTIIFTAVGLTVMAAAGIIIFMSRKKRER